MTNRVCHLLVLSPQMQSRDQAADYRPFGGRSLAAILRDAAAGVSQWISRGHDEHDVIGEFLFGRKSSDEEMLAELQRRVSVVLVDCGIYRDRNGEAAAAAQSVARRLAANSGGERLMILLCNHGCRIDSGFEFQLARTDDALFAYLWSDLGGPAFERVGQLMARRWNG